MEENTNDLSSFLDGLEDLREIEPQPNLEEDTIEKLNNVLKAVKDMYQFGTDHDTNRISIYMTEKEINGHLSAKNISYSESDIAALVASM